MNESPHSYLAANILQFCRALRAAGLPLGTARIIEAMRAAACVGITGRDDFRAALRCILLTDPAERLIFEQAFRLFFLRAAPGRDAGTLAVELGAAEIEAAAQQLSGKGRFTGGDTDNAEAGPADGVAFSAQERLRHKDFEAMTMEEQRAARALLAANIEPLEARPSRRLLPCSSGHRYDRRRSMQLMIRHYGQPVQLARQSPCAKRPALVLLCDISASMRHYSRMFLHLAHIMSRRERHVHSFVFGTRLNNVSRRLRDRDVDFALTEVSRDVRDWEGGTRIASSLKRFNQDWARRIMGQGAVAVLLSDGLERDTEADLGFEMRRLRRSCRELIWLNPLLRYPGFEAKASGIRAMLPHVDRFVSAHNVASLLDLGRLLNGAGWQPTAQPQIERVS